MLVWVGAAPSRNHGGGELGRWGGSMMCRHLVKTWCHIVCEDGQDDCKKHLKSAVLYDSGRS